MTIAPPIATTDLQRALQPVAPAARQLRALIERATTAPSGHNTQPWLFHVPLSCAFVELYADRSRALPVVDPDDRELVMSCGSALYALRIATRHAGHTDLVEVMPDDDDRDLLARVRLGAPYDPTPEDEALFGALASRRTNRRAYLPKPLPPPLLEALQAAAAAEGAVLALLRTADERARAADLVAEGDRVQGSDRAFRRELAAWLHPNRAATRDGIPGHAIGLGDWASYLGPLAVRTFDWGGGRAARDQELALGSPAMALLWTVEDDQRAWIAAGQALQRVLLRATVDGVSASFLNQPVEVPALRARLAEALGIAGAPQCLLRLGYGPEVPSTPRRPLDDVLR